MAQFAPMSHDRRSCRPPPSSFCTKCSGERRHPQDLRRTGRTRLSLRLRLTYSGVRSRALTSASPPTPTSTTAFGSIQVYDRDAGVGDFKDTAKVVAKLRGC